MSDITVPPAAQLALQKLLGKLTLIPPDLAAQPFLGTEACPLKFYAEKGMFDEWVAIEKVATVLNIPVLRADHSNSERLMLLMDDSRVRQVGLQRWRALRAVPFEFEDNVITLAMANPLEMVVVRELEFTLGVKIKIGIAQETQILAILGKQLNLSELFSLENILHSADTKLSKPTREESPKQEQSLFNDDLESAPVIRLVNKILWDGIEEGASDIHISPEQDRVVVRIRVDGMIRELLTVPHDLHRPVVSRLKLLATMDISEKRKPQDGRMRVKTPLGTKDLRISTVPTLHGENVVARVLSSELTRLEFTNLGMSPQIQKGLKRALTGTSRVVLVTGPTGSGKTSTLYSSLMSLNDGTRNLITIEDPIEYKIAGISQIQVNPKIGIHFADGLRSVLRQDPDVVMVGEIRDLETAEVAMQAAQTGHLVLSTLHTNTAAGAITRLRDLGMRGYLMASSLGGLVAQRLIRMLCTSCAKPAPQDVINRGAELGFESATMMVAKGCEACGGSGYLGRCGVFSFLDINDDVREAIRCDASEREIERLARKTLFVSLEEAALALVSKGVTSLEEVERVIGEIDSQSIARTAFEGRTSSSNGSASSTTYGKRKMLIVDDCDDISSVLSLIFEREFFDVTVARDGFEGLEKVYQSKPDIIICDQMMPRMSGFQLLQKLRADKRISEIPVLMLTAADSEEAEVQLIAGGADDFVSKASDKKILVARVNRLLGRVSP